MRHATLFFLFLGCTLLSSCHEAGRCRNVVTSEALSPNGQLKALTFRRLCPEQHSITTHVSILPSSEALPDGNGNVFAYDDEIAIRVAWLMMKGSRSIPMQTRLEARGLNAPAKLQSNIRESWRPIWYRRFRSRVPATPVGARSSRFERI